MQQYGGIAQILNVQSTIKHLDAVSEVVRGKKPQWLINIFNYAELLVELNN